MSPTNAPRTAAPAEPVHSPQSTHPLTDLEADSMASAVANNPFTGLFGSLWNATHGSIRLDLRRPVVPHWKEQESLLRIGSGGQGNQPNATGTAGAAASRAPVRGRRQRDAPPEPASLPPIYPPGLRVAVDEIEPVNQDGSTRPSIMNRAITGARVKVSRHVFLGKAGDGPSWGPFATRKRPPLDLGVGASFELDKGLLIPVARARFGDHIALHAFPEPSIRVEGGWKVLNTGLNLTARYSCPLNNLERFWQPPSRLLIRLDHALGRGVSVGPFGLDGDAKLFESKSRDAYLRVAGSVRFPRQVPVQEGEPVLHVDLRRLGFKSSW